MGKGTLTLRFPSAVIRSRLQVPQKFSDMDVMKLMWPRKPGILKPWGEQGEKGSGGDVDGDGPLSTRSLPDTEPSCHSPLQGIPLEGSTQGPRTTEDSRT